MKRKVVMALALALVAAVVLATALLHPLPASAQFVVTDPGHTAQTILHYLARAVEIAQKAQQILNQYQQLANEARLIANQLQALRQLGEYHFREIEATVAEMEAAMNGPLLPSHLSPAVRAIHSEIYRGWELPIDTWLEERVALSSSLSTMRESLWAKHLQHRMTREHLAELEALKTAVEAAEGHQEVLEALGSLVAFETEAQLLAQLSAQTSADASTAYYSHQLNRLARQGKSLEEAIRTSSHTPPDLGSEPGWGPVPNWWSEP